MECSQEVGGPIGESDYGKRAAYMLEQVQMGIDNRVMSVLD